MQPIELTYDERERLANEHYATHYEVLVDYPFLAPKPIRLNNHDPRDQAARRCRFCRRGAPDVTFKEGDAPEPYLWCVVQSGGHRLQILVPGCPADRELFAQRPATFTARQYRLPEFGPGWAYGETEYRRLDWSSPLPEQTTFKAVWNVVEGRRITANDSPLE